MNPLDLAYSRIDEEPLAEENYTDRKDYYSGHRQHGTSAPDNYEAI